MEDYQRKFPEDKLTRGRFEKASYDIYETENSTRCFQALGKTWIYKEVANTTTELIWRSKFWEER